MVWKRWGRKLAGSLMILALTGAVDAQEEVVPRALFVAQAQNPNQAFMVRVTVDREDRVYREGDLLTASVQSSADGFLYLFNRDSQGTVRCLFPNKYQQNNAIKSGERMLVPPQNVQREKEKFQIVIGAPFGDEVLKAIVTTERLPFDDERLRQAAATEINFAGVKAAFVQAVPGQAATWAEHSVEFRTVSKAGDVSGRGGRRVGLFVGLAKYRDSTIRPLPACRADAATMLKTMKTHGQLDAAFLLVDEEATLANIVDHIENKLVQGTRPGDTIFIYWSGHGGRCADDNGDEKIDGLDEFLVTYDARTDDVDLLRRSVLLDDHFGRLLQHLDGRKIVLMLDTCHSGGQATNEKGLPNLEEAKSTEELDMFDGDLQHTKDIGQKETALLVSSSADQISFVCKEGEISVMTKFLDQLIRESQGPLSLTDAAAQLKKLVPAYVKERFPGATQLPQLIDNTSPPLYLRN